MKLASYTAILVIVSWSLLSVAQLWGPLVSAETYWKISITMALIGGGIVIASLIAKEYLSEKKMKKDKYID